MKLCNFDSVEHKLDNELLNRKVKPFWDKSFALFVTLYFNHTQGLINNFINKRHLKNEKETI